MGSKIFGSILLFGKIVLTMIVQIYEFICKMITNPFVIAVISAVLVYVFNKYNEFKAKNEERLSVFNALHAELSSLEMLIQSREEQFLEFASSDSKKTFFPYISITLNYFSVYDNLSSKFGLINNQATIEQIIKCYTEVKGLFDDVKDLEYYAKLIINPAFQVNINQSQETAIVKSYRQNLQCIVNNQLPMVKGLIKQTIQCIIEEKRKVVFKNTIKGFLFG